MSSEPEVTELDDEVGEIPLAGAASTSDVPSPMAELPTGAQFGTLVHAVLETTDPSAADLAAELEAQINVHSVWCAGRCARTATCHGDGPDARHPLGPLAAG